MWIGDEARLIGVTGIFGRSKFSVMPAPPVTCMAPGEGAMTAWWWPSCVFSAQNWASLLVGCSSSVSFLFLSAPCFFLFSSLFSLFSSLFSLFTSFLCHKVWSLPLCGLPHWCWRLHHPLFLQLSGSYSAFGCKEGEVPGKSTMNILGKVLQTIGIFTSSSSMRSFLHPGTALELSITFNTKCR